jgi:hypothetical protein
MARRLRELPYDAPTFTDSEQAAKQLLAWRGRESELERISELRAGWDGDGADAPSPDAVVKAWDFFEQISRDQPDDPPVWITASRDGGILFQWQSPGVYLEAEIDGGENAEWMRARGGHFEHWTRKIRPRRNVERDAAWVAPAWTEARSAWRAVGFNQYAAAIQM